MRELRTPEWISILAFCWFSMLACSRRSLDRGRRAKIIALGFGGVAITILASVVLPRLVPPQPALIVRDWIPYLFLFMFYSQGGQFVTGADVKLEEKLERLDSKIVAPLLEWCARRTAGIWILTYLEIAYLSYYPVLPLALVALYLSGQRLTPLRFGPWFSWLPMDLVERFRSSRRGRHACLGKSGACPCQLAGCGP